MAMKLVFQGGEHPQFPLLEGNCCIGSALDADIPLGHDGIEPVHCELLVAAHGEFVRFAVDHHRQRDLAHGGLGVGLHDGGAARLGAHRFQAR